MTEPAARQPTPGQPTPGQSAELSYQVSAEDTATALGSGDVPVLATPRLLAWLEAATLAALGPLLDGDRTSVGTRVELDHLIASRVGAGLTVRAELTAVDGRLVRFEVVAREVVARDGDAPDTMARGAAAPDTVAHDAIGRVVARGRITRVIVDRERFLGRAVDEQRG